MKSTEIKQYSLEELRKMRDRGESLSSPATGNEPDMPDSFWENAELVVPVEKTPVSLRVDRDIIEFFKAQGKGHLTKMHSVLRTYVDAHKT